MINTKMELWIKNQCNKSNLEIRPIKYLVENREQFIYYDFHVLIQVEASVKLESNK